jgi:hypothetical protein
LERKKTGEEAGVEVRRCQSFSEIVAECRRISSLDISALERTALIVAVTPNSPRVEKRFLNIEYVVFDAGQPRHRYLSSAGEVIDEGRLQQSVRRSLALVDMTVYSGMTKMQWQVIGCYQEVNKQVTGQLVNDLNGAVRTLSKIVRTSRDLGSLYDAATAVPSVVAHHSKLWVPEPCKAPGGAMVLCMDLTEGAEQPFRILTHEAIEPWIVRYE